MFIAHDFSRQRKRTTERVLRFEIGFKRTAVFWWNVRLLNASGTDNECVNLPPAVFAQLLPEVSPQSIAGRIEVNYDTVRALGFDITPGVTAV